MKADEGRPLVTRSVMHSLGSLGGVSASLRRRPPTETGRIFADMKWWLG